MSTKSRDIWDIADRSGRPSPEGSSLEPTWSLTHLPAISAESAWGGGRSRGISGLQLVAVVTPTELGAPGGRCQAGGLCAVPSSPPTARCREQRGCQAPPPDRMDASSPQPRAGSRKGMSSELPPLRWHMPRRDFRERLPRGFFDWQLTI